MSYDIHIVDADGKQLFANHHQLRGGTYAVGGTNELWLNVTYNYSGHFRRVLGEKGIRSIYGMRCADAIPILQAAAQRLQDDAVDDYWAAIEGNVKAALLDLAALGQLAPDGFFDGD